MKLSLPQIHNPFDFTPKHINRLVIENSTEFSSVVQRLKNQFDFGESYATLFDNIEEQNFTRNVDVIYSPIQFSINSSSVLNSLHKNLSGEANSERYFLKTSELKTQVINYIESILYNRDADFIFDEDLDMSKFFKLMGVKYNDIYETLVEKLLKFLMASQELEGDKIFIFINLSDYLSIEDKNRLYETILAKDIKIFLIDRNLYDRNALEKLVIIDKDLCEI